MALERLTYTEPLLQVIALLASGNNEWAGRVGCVDGGGASLARATNSADLGGSSKYSSENLED